MTKTLTNNTTLGRGKLYFARFKDGTKTPDGFRFIGNAPSFSLNIQNDTLDHFKSTGGVKVKDKSIVLQTNQTGSLTCDDIQIENLALFFFGEASTLVQGAATAVTETISDVIPGRMYQIGVNNSTNPTGVRSISNVVVEKGATTFVVDDDYTVDLALGTITVVEGGTIVTGDDLEITYDKAAKSRDQVVSGTTQQEGALRYIADNPEGEDFDYWCPYVRVSPNGDYNLIGDDWSVMALNVEILDPDDGRKRMYLDGRAYTP